MPGEVQLAIMAGMTLLGAIEGKHSASEKEKQAQEQATSRNIASYNSALSNYYNVSSTDASYGIVGSSYKAPKAQDFGLSSSDISNAGGVTGANRYIMDNQATGALFGTVAHAAQVSTVDSITQGAVSGLQLGSSLASAYGSFSASKAVKPLTTKKG